MTSTGETRQVFQMCLARDGVEGYVFPNELGDLYVSPVFTVPQGPGETGTDLVRFRYKFPGMIGDEYQDFLLVYDRKEETFLLKHPDLTKPIRFSFHYPFDPLAQREYPYLRSFPYIGEKKAVVESFTHFIPLLPLDFQLMDEAYLKAKIVFVGKTDTFPG